MIETTLEDILDTFDFFESWEDRYRFIIDLGRKLEPLAPHEMADIHKVKGCTSQVWLIPLGIKDGKLQFKGDSDSHIVKGLVAILLVLFDNKTKEEILGTDVKAIFKELGLEGHLSPSRSNGFFSMVEKIKELAESVQA